MVRRSKQTSLWALAAILLTALPILGLLQYRWLGQLHTAERERLETSLAQGLAGFRQEFNWEIHRLNSAFQVPLGQRAEPILKRWLRQTAYPDLLEGAYLGIAGTEENRSWYRVQVGRVLSAQPPEEVASLAAEQSNSPFQSPRRVGDRWLIMRPFAIPVAEIVDIVDLAAKFASDRAGGLAHDPPRLQLRDHHLVAIDLERFRETLVVPMVERHLPAALEGFDYGIVARVEKDEVIVASATVENAADLEPLDGEVELLRPEDLSFEALVGGGSQMRDALSGSGCAADDAECDPLVLSFFVNGVSTSGDTQLSAPQPRWSLRVRHRRGSLAAALERVRRRNLAVSGGVLVVLGAGLALLALLVVRTQRLAQAQMDFVAGVSHELRTPLSVISSAGANLADGIIDEPERVQIYGAQLQRESRRLRELVDRVLTFAKLGGGRMETGPVSVEPLMRRVLEDVAGQTQAEGIRVETRFATGLPAARTNAVALESALQNLVSNAIKYGGSGGALTVEVEAESGDGGSRVCIAVRDRGPGIAVEDRKKLFDAFYRGTTARDQQLPGTGLGLNLVHRMMQALGGRVSLDLNHSPGAAFLLHLPAMPDSAVPVSSTAHSSIPHSSISHRGATR